MTFHSFTQRHPFVSALSSLALCSALAGCTSEVTTPPTPEPIAADALDGTWTLRAEVSEEEVEEQTWVIDQTGDEVAITYGMFRGSEAWLEGNTFKMKFHPEDDFEINLAGDVNGDVISGTFGGTAGSGETMTGTFTLTRTSPSMVVPELAVPAASITVDGDASDWDGIPAVIVDPEGDGRGPGGNGTDIKAVRVARSDDGARLHLLIEVADGPIRIDDRNGYQIRFYGDHWMFLREQMIDIYPADDPLAWILQQRQSLPSGDNDHHRLDGDVAVGDHAVELSFPIDALDHLSASETFDALRIDVRAESDSGDDRDDATVFGLLNLTGE